ncbi:MAG TPA: hypothetical protein RMH99_27410 [Sandaracinaceae bacterium LLY-WYZ-13_1]|nr:hypothetical protein [Sandaracinaceae bacterium LLY-WYZ-13_1]
MSRLQTCRCGAFLPPGRAACPHCASRIPRWLARTAWAVGGGMLSMTLSACYGAPCAGSGACRPMPAPVPTDATGCAHPDLDADGFCGPADCAEGDPDVHAGAFDAPRDGRDTDCDGLD